MSEELGDGPAVSVGGGATLLFAAQDKAHGEELWQSDGTRAGTRPMRDIRAGPRGSHPGWLVDAGGTVFFAASDAMHGRELWMVNTKPHKCGALLGQSLLAQRRTHQYRIDLLDDLGVQSPPDWSGLAA
jgi:ELWxxDGT repeat protein